MAPRATSKSKHKSKGEKKKKDDKLLPNVLDILVNLPSGDEVTLKGISTDRILDVRKLLAVNVETCHLTRFSLSHEIRGEQLIDTQEIVHLKPCILTLVEETYTEGQAIDHVRRLLDLVSSTTCFGHCDKGSKDENVGKCNRESREAKAAGMNSSKASENKDAPKLCPPSKLEKFYEFFSLGNLKAPVQSVRNLSRQHCTGKDFFALEVKVANGKLFTVVASATGFYHPNKQQIRSHTLVDLLRHLSKAFNDAYEDLLNGFRERNKFANIPYGLRANTWVVPPLAAQSPSSFPPLPAEDETWGGNGGGRGQVPHSLEKPWAEMFDAVAKMPCATSEEREIRDHKAFVLHNHFVDVATTEAVDVLRGLEFTRTTEDQHVEYRGTLKFTVSRNASNPSIKATWKIDSSSTSSRKLSQESISERNLLKGITADESTVVHDVSTLGVVLVRHLGYIVVVEAISSGKPANHEDIVDPPDGGANALNANSLRSLLHRKPTRTEAVSELNRAQDLVHKTIEDGILSLSLEQPFSESKFIRWELGACWIQHLGEANPKESGVKTKDNGEHEHSYLKGVLSESSLERLKETRTGLHMKSALELTTAAQAYYNNVALPKLVSDFAALELSPVEGRTLTDFMHIRGLRISSLGKLADLCSKLPHIRSLCIHEMIIRAFKRFMRAIVASVKDTSELAVTIATVLNTIFRSLPKEGRKDAEPPLWKWLELFVLRRFGWKLAYDSRLNLRNYAILRGICYKVGIEMAPRDYDFGSSTPITKADVISMVPVYKHAICSSADGRTLLESSKAALDKGKLEDAVSFGCKALTKLIAVCGPYHRMTAGAYSLLAVVLYHTGDFNQAMVYQQKALDINERELGLDHPDTMKSYGDLAVFYYRLQHTELALRYVNRALYLLHLICGASHPNTAATYINVAMMEEALGNADVALRYLHEALKCNERLLGKDHIQTAASYHAIAIALSLMEAYTLSVHHEQTTFQILQSKLGPDDIRTQDAAAWLEYFDSKAVEQQEAARTGAPKPDPSVASKGHLSVSDLLDFINAEVVGANQKDSKKAKRLKLFSSNKNLVDVEDAVKEEGATETPKLDNEPPLVNNALEREQETRDSSMPKIDHSESALDVLHQEPERDGWLEFTSRGKHHKTRKATFVMTSQTPNSTGPISSLTTKLSTPENVTKEPVQQSSEGAETTHEDVIKEPPEQCSEGAPIPEKQPGTRSYKDVALMKPATSFLQARPLQSKSKGQVEVKQVEDMSRTEEHGDVEEQASSNSLSASAQPFSPRNAVTVTPMKATAGKASQAPRSSSPPGSVQSTTVAVTPIRKQVQLPSNTPAAQACIARGSASEACQALTPAAVETCQALPAAPVGTPGKKLMNPFATEFVPGRKWHPFVPSETNTLQTGGSNEKQQSSEPELQAERQDMIMNGDKEDQQTRLCSAEAESVTEKGSEVEVDNPADAYKGENGQDNIDTGTKEQHISVVNDEVSTEAGIAVGGTEEPDGKPEFKASQQPAACAALSDSYSSDSNCTERSSSTEKLGFVEVRKRNGRSSKARGRWQRRPDGAITRVYRLQGDKSSSNPQLRTTSTFTDVPEPHTLQSVPIMRRSVRVS